MKLFSVLIIAAAVFILIWANKIRIYLKWQKKAEADNKPFYRWPESVHQEPEQRKRLRQAQAENFQVEAVGKNGGKICRMKAASDPGSHGRYETFLDNCPCGDFIQNRVPCKHIYRIALNKGLIQAAPEGKS